MEQKDVQNVEEKTTEKVGTQTTEEKEVKTFTQEEVNTMIQDRLAKEKKKMPSQEELKAYNEWKESQKTEAEKQQEILSKVDKLEKDGISKDQVITMLKKGVSSDDLDYIQFKLSKMEGDFEENLGKFLSENTRFLANQKEEHKATGTSVVNNGSSHSSNGVLDILAEKHKNIDFRN